MGAGDNFEHKILNAILNSDVVLAIIGQNWISSRDRLFEDKDVLRMELEYALRWRISVIPVLIDRAFMPEAEQLPPV